MWDGEMLARLISTGKRCTFIYVYDYDRQTNKPYYGSKNNSKGRYTYIFS